MKRENDMEVGIVILGAFVLLLVIVVICLGNKYNRVKETLKETELDLQEYVRKAHDDAKIINELNSHIKDLDNSLTTQKTE